MADGPIIMKANEIASKSELAEFRSQLSKELEQFRAHVSKNVIPIAKTLDEKIQSINTVSQVPTREPLQPLLIIVAALLICSILGSAGFLFVSLSKSTDIDQLKQELTRVVPKSDR